MILIILLASFLVFLLLGMPVAFAIGAASLAALVASDQSLVLLSHFMYIGMESYVLVSVPLFVLAGEIMLRGGMTRSLTEFADMLVGRLRGGMGHTNIAGSVFFAGITGSASADTTALGSVLIPAMAEKGYDRAYATAITIASSVIGPIIPPSLTFVIYAMAVGGDVSIGQLFLAGIVPGILVAFALMVMNYWISHKRGYEKRTTRYSFAEIVQITLRSLIVLVMPGIIVLGVLSGNFTATESAAVASVYALVVCFFVTRTLKLAELPSIFFSSAKVSSIMLLLLATSSILSYVLTTQGVPRYLAEFFTSVTENKYVFLLLLNVMLLAIGTVLDLFPAIIIFGPIFAQIADGYGVDPVHFAVVFCVNLLLGLNTPPVGSGLFIGAAVGRVKLEDLIRQVRPFILMEVVVLLVLTYVPALTTELPRELARLLGW
ncbi:TRAP transporter large permease [Nitratireductor aquimarinus]|uniref:TRAP transporter large permease protein n=1 Tax=Nitratireductor aquimarinus TaxID=889300 RepID=A0ABU4AM07_9HYPH|nr:TRAP transporter large permease [Nitratireductor aquimarinus]MDV6227270.1 TRAP transporter large permease [Nitratireductor aquimarinus]